MFSNATSSRIKHVLLVSFPPKKNQAEKVHSFESLGSWVSMYSIILSNSQCFSCNLEQIVTICRIVELQLITASLIRPLSFVQAILAYVRPLILVAAFYNFVYFNLGRYAFRRYMMRYDAIIMNIVINSNIKSIENNGLLDIAY